MRFAGQLAELLHGAQALVQCGEVQLSVPRDPADDAVAPGETEGKNGEKHGKMGKNGKNWRKVPKKCGKMEEQVGKEIRKLGEMWKKSSKSIGPSRWFQIKYKLNAKFHQD